MVLMKDVFEEAFLCSNVLSRNICADDLQAIRPKRGFSMCGEMSIPMPEVHSDSLGLGGEHHLLYTTYLNMRRGWWIAEVSQNTWMCGIGSEGDPEYEDENIHAYLGSMMTEDEAADWLTRKVESGDLVNVYSGKITKIIPLNNDSKITVGTGWRTMIIGKGIEAVKHLDGCWIVELFGVRCKMTEDYLIDWLYENSNLVKDVSVYEFDFI